MERENGRRPESQRGRKQDPSRSEAILGATRALLLERGYDRFTIQDVAEAAGSGVGAIYRRWKNRESLVAEAIRTGGELSSGRSDDAAADLGNLIASRAALATSHPDFVPGVVSAMRTSAEINQAMQLVHTTSPYEEALARLLGDEHPHLQLLAELAPAIIVHRTIFGGPLDPETFSNDVLMLVRALASAPQATTES